jgi:hypothetical protein
LYITDSKAVHHILSNSYLYQKPAPGRYFLGRVVGPGTAASTRSHKCHNVYTSYLLPEGILVVENVHKKQVSIDCMRNIWLVLITFSAKLW